MKNTILLMLLMFSFSAFAYTPTWNPDWDNQGTQHQQRNDRSQDNWGHNHLKKPAQGDFDWDKHADRGEMNQN
jgi:hypothetical protein